MTDSHVRSIYLLSLLLLSAAVALCVSADMTPVTRMQEARVLMTGRDMVGQPPRRWIIPQTNGDVRLRKPPLAYWMSAVSYATLGRGNFAGRLPAVLAALATLALTFAIGRRLFDDRVGLYAAVALLGSWLFFKQAMLAETDLYSVVFLCAGIWLALRPESRLGRHGIAAITALLLMTKGPPAALLVGFILLLDLTSGRGMRNGLLGRVFFSPAIITFAILGLPWFIRAYLSPDGKQLTDDLENSAGGGMGHRASPLAYAPLLMQALAPWSLLWLVSAISATVIILRHLGLPPRPVAVWHAWRTSRLARLRRRFGRPLQPADAGLVPLFCWGAVVFVPLLFWGNKQLHYLLPFAPAAAIGIGWVLRRIETLGSPFWATGFVRAFAKVLIALCCVAPLVPLAGGWQSRHDLTPADLSAAGVLVAAAVTLAMVGRRIGLLPTMLLVFAIALGVLKGFWITTLGQETQSDIAAMVERDYPEAVIRFRYEASLPFCLALGRNAPAREDAALDALRADPAVAKSLLFIETGEAPTPPPAAYREIGRVKQNESTWIFLAPPESRFYPRSAATQAWAKR